MKVSLRNAFLYWLLCVLSIGLSVSVCRGATAPQTPSQPCPTSDEITSRVTLSATTLSGQDLTDFNAVKDQAIGKIESHPAPATTRGFAPTPQEVIADLVSRAGQEFGQYLLGDLLTRLCQDPNGKNYFPNTCALTHPQGSKVALQDAWTGLSSTSGFEQLRVSLRLDAESLPSCLLFQRTHNHSLSGYLLESLVKTLIADNQHNYKAVLHSLATNSIAEAECDGYPQQQSAGCQIYLAIVAIDAGIFARTSQSGSFTFSGALNGSDLTTLDNVAATFTGAFVADLSIAHCSIPAHPATLCPDAITAGSSTLVAWWIDYLGKAWWVAHNPTRDNPSPQPYVTAFADFLKTVDTVAKADQIVVSLQKIAATAAGPAPGHNPTPSEKSRTEDAQGQQQQLQLQLLGAITDLAGDALTTFGRISFPTELSDQSKAIKPNVQAKQIQQVAAAAVYALYAYRDFQQRDYADGVSQALAGIRALDCRETGKTLPADPQGQCGFLLSNPTLGSALEALGYVATLASTTDATSFADAVNNISGGPDAWKRKTTEKIFWAGSFVGVQGGHQWLSAPEYSRSSSEYGLFAPLGVGFSWPEVVLKRPVNVFLSVVDLGSLISTSTGTSSTSGTVKGGANSGWSQLLAPGLYSSIQAYGPLYFGVGYVFRTPSLRTVTLPNNTTVNADSSRLQIFVGVDVPLFSIDP